MSNNTSGTPFKKLEDFLQLLKTDVLNSMQAKGKIASGQTAAQITVENDDKGAKLELPGYLQLLETGRGPTGKNAIAGNPPMIERIKLWCQAKGIPDKAAWAIKKSIDKKGFKGTPGILSEPLGNDNINLRLNQSLNEITTTLITQITDNIP